MGADRTSVGRDRERRRAGEALRARRSVILSGPAGSGRSHLLAAVLRAHPRSGILIDARAGVVTVRTGSTDRRVLAGGDDVTALIAEAAARSEVVGVDDIDEIPDAVAAALVEALAVADVVFVAATAPRHEITRRSRARAELLRPLLDDGDRAHIAVGPLALGETTALANALRSDHHGVGPADDAWTAALHHLSGGNPALIGALVEVAAVRGRLHAVCPIEPFVDPLPGGLVASLTRLLAPLDARDRGFLGVVSELGAVPLAHVAAIVPAEVLARLHDGNLLVVSPDAGTAAVSPLLARMVGETAREDGEPDDRRDVALRLLDLATHGDALTPSEEVYCARHGAVEAGSPRAATLAALLPRAALSLARSSAPRDALAVVARMSEPDADLRASAAVILARIALDDHDAAARALEILPRPATAVERELALHVVVRTLCATCAGLDAARTRLREVIEWAPDDDDWRTRVAHAEAMLALPHGASFPERASASAADTPRPDAEAFDDALRAATAAAGGDAARARALWAAVRRRTGGTSSPTSRCSCSTPTRW